MVDRQIERAAYIAAHAISTADLVATHLVCPGARNTHKVDVIAGIIKNVFEAMQAQEQQSRGPAQIPERDWRIGPALAPGPNQSLRLAKRGA